MASVTVCGDVADAIDGCSAVILPLPVSMDGVSLNSPNSNITLAELLRIIPDNAIILAGRIPPALPKLAAHAAYSPSITLITKPSE